MAAAAHPLRLDQDMKQIMDSLLPEDQKISLLDQLLHRCQGLSRQMKTDATVKPTVVTNVTPAPTEESPTHTPTTSLGKSEKVRRQKQSWLSWLVRGFLSERSPVRSSVISTSASTFL